MKRGKGFKAGHCFGPQLRDGPRRVVAPWPFLLSDIHNQRRIPPRIGARTTFFLWSRFAPAVRRKSFLLAFRLILRRFIDTSMCFDAMVGVSGNSYNKRINCSHSSLIRQERSETRLNLLLTSQMRPKTELRIIKPTALTHPSLQTLQNPFHGLCQAGLRRPPSGDSRRPWRPLLRRYDASGERSAPSPSPQ